MLDFRRFTERERCRSKAAEIMDDRCGTGEWSADGVQWRQLQNLSLHGADPRGGPACVWPASDGFTSHMMRGDRREEGRDGDRVREAAGEEEKGQRGVWNPRERRGGRGSTMMWLASIHRENKFSLRSTTVITKQTGRKWAACSPQTPTRPDTTWSAILQPEIKFKKIEGSESVAACSLFCN